MTLTVHPFPAALGAEIRGLDLREEVAAADFDRIIKAWHEHLVICFRDQALDEDTQIRFARRFGEPVARPTIRADHPGAGAANPYTMLVTNLKRDGGWLGDLPVGELSFHSDGAFNRVPYKASMLYAIEVPPSGGETVFANMYKVFDALEPETRALLEGCTADNFFEYDANTHTEPGKIGALEDADAPHYVHPVVVAHPATGRRALFVSRRMTRCVNELAPEIYEPVLARIYDMVESNEFTYAHQWRPGDIVIWDNRCTQHGRRDFAPDSRRLLRRIAIMGDTQPEREVAPAARIAI